MYAPNTSYPSNDVEMLSCGFLHPNEIVRDYSLSIEEKREILAHWASDARSIEDHPAYRLIEAGQLIPLDEILKAMAQLDEASGCQDDLRLSEEKRQNQKKPNEKDDDDPDDDPPPVPAGVFVPLPPNPPSIPELAF